MHAWRECLLLLLYPSEAWGRVIENCMDLEYKPASELRVGVDDSPAGPVDPSLRGFSGRFEFTVRRLKLNQDSL